MRKFAMILALLCMLLTLAGCGKECAMGCGEKADSSCTAEMCDDCCDYWMGLNGCTKDH